MAVNLGIFSLGSCCNSWCGVQSQEFCTSSKLTQRTCIFTWKLLKQWIWTRGHADSHAFPSPLTLPILVRWLTPPLSCVRSSRHRTLFYKGRSDIEMKYLTINGIITLNFSTKKKWVTSSEGIEISTLGVWLCWDEKVIWCKVKEKS